MRVEAKHGVLPAYRKAIDDVVSAMTTVCISVRVEQKKFLLKIYFQYLERIYF